MTLILNDLPLPPWLALTAAVAALVLLLTGGRRIWVRLNRGRAHRRAASSPATLERLRPAPAEIAAPAPLPVRVPGRWIDPPLGNPAFVAAVRRHPSYNGAATVTLPVQRTGSPRRFPLSDSDAAPLDDLVSTPRIADAAPFQTLPDGRIVAVSGAALFDAPVDLVPIGSYRPGSWADEDTTAAASGTER